MRGVVKPSEPEGPVPVATGHNPPDQVGAAEAPPAGGAPVQASRRRAFVDVVAQVIGRIFNLGLGVVVTLIIVRALGDRGFGQWATIFAVVQIATTVCDMGLVSVTVKHAAREPATEGAWLGALVTLRAALTVPVTLASVAVVLALSTTSQMRVAGALLCLTLFTGVASGYTAMYQLRVRNDLAIAVMTVNSVVWTASAAAIALAGAGMVAFAVAFIGAAVASTAFNVVLARRLGSVQLAGSRRMWGELGRAAVAVGGAGLLITAYVRIDQLIVYEYAGARQAGLYGAAYRILDQAQFVPAAVMTTLFPMLSAAYPRDLDRVRRLTQAALSYLAMASLPALSFALVAGRPTMELLFGRDFAAAGPALAVLIGAFVCISLGYIVGYLRIALGLQNTYLVYAALGLVVNVGLNLLLVPRYGFIAAAWVTLITEVLVLALSSRVVLNRLELWPELGPFGRIAAAAAALALGLAALRAAGLGVVALALAAVVLYVGLLFAVRALSVAELTTLLRREEP
jgi:O-antigen/teichoic acid export membrane protein